MDSFQCLFILTDAFGFDSLRSKWNAPIFFFHRPMFSLCPRHPFTTAVSGTHNACYASPQRLPVLDFLTFRAHRGRRGHIASCAGAAVGTSAGFPRKIRLLLRVSQCRVLDTSVFAQPQEPGGTEAGPLSVCHRSSLESRDLESVAESRVRDILLFIESVFNSELTKSK